MPELDEESWKVAKSNLQSELERAIGTSPQGLKESELDECWRLAKDYWNIKTNQERR
ncbi:unnamed protein product [marine sediment metagenome]|uniref:Uncharacterized protein n=1 Tax=marine sediment metagenome TaxID=412755 RepID=X1K050_9ZZZZ